MVGVRPVVFPMYVGVILRVEKMMLDDDGVPHVCGGDPYFCNK